MTSIEKCILEHSIVEFLYIYRLLYNYSLELLARSIGTTTLRRPLAFPTSLLRYSLLPSEYAREEAPIVL